MAESRKPTEEERKILEREMERERKRRDKAVNNERARKRGPSTHRPTPRRTRKQIMDELSGG